MNSESIVYSNKCSLKTSFLHYYFPTNYALTSTIVNFQELFG